MLPAEAVRLNYIREFFDIMTTPHYPSAQASPEQGPDPAAVSAPPAPHPAAAAATSSRRAWRGLDYVLTFLVLLLAFLTASFLARNSDLWFHLAAGRLLAQGQFHFGTDPFAYTTGQVYWANHAWLFDLGLYGLYSLIGGTGLVVLKALLVTALAGLLLCVRRPDGPAWLAAGCTTLAILAMSPRLLVQPACVSYFFLGLTFWLLWKPHAQAVASGQWPVASEGTPSATSHWPLATGHWSLLLVFALWVNVDEWFLLGPVLAALFWLGERLQGQRQTPGWLVPAGLAACLLNPHTYHAFVLPAELSSVPWTSGLRQDVHLHAQFTSPWREYLYAAAKLNAAALAYFALLSLGLVSFLLHPQALRGWRLVVWLPFAVLAACQARSIPFFAVVAAPITVLNFQGFLASRAKREARSGEREASPIVPWAWRFGLCASLLALIFLSWPGWLAGYGREERRVAWGLQAEPSLRQAAQTLHDWRRLGLLAEGERVFALSPEVAQYAAWFCPGEKQFFDHRYSLFPETARDYEAVCRALEPDRVPDQGGEQATDWRQVLREHGVGIVVFYEREPQRLFAVLPRLASDPKQWTLLHVAGQALIAGWNEARPPGAFAPLALNADRLAFGLQDARAQRELPAAPEQGPEHLPPRRDFWGRLAHPAASPTWESAASSVYLHYFDDSRPQQQRSVVSSYAASLATLPALPSAVPQALLQLMSAGKVFFSREDKFLLRDDLGPFLAQLLERSPALPLLAIRAARRAVAANPEDSNAWLRLGQAYLLLRLVTCERSAEGLLPPLVQLRHVQIVTALEQAVQLDSDLEAAHHELADLYGQSNYLDQALEHQREELRLSRRAGPRAGETAEVSADRLEILEKEVAKLEELVPQNRQAYAASAGTLQGERLAQANLALKLGLARQAADEILLPAPAALLGTTGIKLELELLLKLGRAEKVRPILSDEALIASRDKLSYYDVPMPPNRNPTAPYPMPYRWPAYEWLDVLQAAAVGDYAQAHRQLRAIRSGMEAGHDRLKQRLRLFEGRENALLPGLLSGPPAFLPAFTARTLTQFLQERMGLQAVERVLRAQQADLCVLEGLLALEEGATAVARSAFAQARQLSMQPPGTPVPFAGEAITAEYLSKMNVKD